MEVRRAVARIDDAMVGTDVWRELCASLDSAIPGPGSMIYDWRDEATVGRMVTTLDVNDVWITTVRSALPRFRLYNPSSRSTDHRAGRPLNLDQTLRNRASAVEFRERLCEPAYINDYVRATIWDRDRFVAWVGTFRARGERVRDDDRAKLRLLVPRVRAVIRAEGILRGAHRDVLALIDVLPQPVFLVDERGALLHANLRARTLWPARPTWLRGAPTRISPGLAHVVRAPLRDLRAWLVLPSRDDAAGLRLALPGALVSTADALARGLTDKEIAEATLRPFATVRTYVERLYRHLGVQHRVRAARVLWRAGFGGDDDDEQ